MTLVQTLTVGSGGAASIEFTGIPQDGTDLLVLLSGRIDVAAENRTLQVQFNNSATAQYYERLLQGTGSSAYSDSSGGGFGFHNLGAVLPGNSVTSNTFGSVRFYITNYTASASKSGSLEAVTENNATAAYQSLYATRWDNTAAITSIKLYSSQNWMQHSTASLYKITKA